MLLQEDMPFDDWFDKENCYYYNCNDNFIIIDNLNCDNKISFDKEKFYCSSFFNAIFVLEGKMKIVVDGNIFFIEKNEYFLVMPCNDIEFVNSDAKFFIIVPRVHIVLNIYDNINLPEKFKRIAFTIIHYKLDKIRISNILAIYNIIKKESLSPNYLYQELVLREMFNIFVLETFANTNVNDEIVYLPNSKQRTLFLNFLDILSEEYLYQRSVAFYANKLGITAKYLSFVTKLFTNKSASAVIDNFVVFKIKVLLYDGELSVKSISKLFNFKSQSFFGRFFKRITGLSPKSFVAKYNRRLLKIQ